MIMRNKLLLLLSLVVANSLFAQKEETIFYDDFIDNRNAWAIGTNESTSYEIKNGKYYFQSKTKENSWTLYNTNQKPFDGNKDFKVEWTFQQEKGADDYGVGLFCYKNDEMSKGFGIWLSSDGKWKGLIPSDSSATTDWQEERLVKKGNQVSNTVSILKIGNTISFIINNETVYQNKYAPGNIKRIGYQIGNEKTIAIDYVKIVYISGEYEVPTYSIDAKFNKFFDEGKALYNKRDYDRAIVSFTEAINLKPEIAYTYDWRGASYQFKNEPEIDITISDYKEALRLNPKNAFYHYKLGGIYYDQKKTEIALQELNEALKLDPKYVDAFIKKGDVFKGLKLTDSALSCYTQAIRIDPKKFEAYRSRASIYANLKDYEKAALEYGKILKIDSTNISAYSNKAGIYRNQKLYDLAILDYTTAIRISPKTTYLYSSRAYAYKEQGNIELAINDYNEYVKINGKASGLISRGYFYMDLKKQDLALADFNQAISLEPKNVSVYSARARYFRINKQFELAKIDYATAIQIDPNYFNVYFNRGIMYKAQGQYKLAIADFEMSVQKNPKALVYKSSLVAPLLRTGQLARAKEFAQKVIESDSYKDGDYKYLRRYHQVVANYLPTEEYGKAIVELDKAIEEYTASSIDKEDSETDFIDVLSLKGYVLEKLNRNKEARAVYEQCLVINEVQPDVLEAIGGLQKKTTIIAGNDKIAPEIQLISPQPSRGLQIVGDNSKIELIGKAKDPSGIATVSINGKPVTKIEEDGLFISSLTLKPGVNSIVINAADKKGNSISKTFTVMGNAVAKKQEPDIIIPVTTSETAPQFHALLIAANDYSDPKIADLENPVKDATELKNILQANYTFAAQNIVQ
jgi:tetratricopeptide (TPR) repeat protein